MGYNTCKGNLSIATLGTTDKNRVQKVINLFVSPFSFYFLAVVPSVINHLWFGIRGKGGGRVLHCDRDLT